jgi:nucleoside-diphosphate-sugar epimerase
MPGTHPILVTGAGGGVGGVGRMVVEQLRAHGVTVRALVHTDSGVDHALEFYPARHGFAVPDNPTYNAEANLRHWEALHQLYRANLHDS